MQSLDRFAGTDEDWREFWGVFWNLKNILILKIWICILEFFLLFLQLKINFSHSNDLADNLS